MPTDIFPEIINGLLLKSIIVKCLQNVKLVALSVPEIIEGTQKWQSLDMPTLPFFVQMDPVNVPAKFEVHSFTRS